MKTLRKSSERGSADHGWLKSKHTFSFGDYHDAQHMGVSVLRVINEDRVSGGQGFGTHPHKDMEIISYVVSGALQHKDTMGNSSLIKPGELQYMSAGTGVMHSEFNPLEKEEAHFLQIWIIPDHKGHSPRYGQKSFSTELAQQDLVLMASSDASNGSLAIHQDVKIYGAKWDSAKEMNLDLNEKRKTWIQLIHGQLNVNGSQLNNGDALLLENETKLSVKSIAGSEFLVFDLP